MFAKGTEVQYMGTDSRLIGKRGIVLSLKTFHHVAGYTKVQWVGGEVSSVANQCLMEVNAPLKAGASVRYVGLNSTLIGKVGTVLRTETTPAGNIQATVGFPGYPNVIICYTKYLEKLQKQPAGETAEQPKETAPAAPKDMVHSPSHYALFEDLEAIDVIARSMTVEMFKGYCLGNLLKYRLRAGKKDSVAQDLAKADKYNEIFEKHKGQCRDAS